MPTTRMPTFSEVLDFCKELEKFLPDYKFADSQEDARVGLLVNQKIPAPPLYTKQNFSKMKISEEIFSESEKKFEGIPIVVQ